MDDKKELDLNEKTFAEKFQSSFHRIGKQMGACPPAELLLRWQSGELSEEDSIRIKEHITGCGPCDFLSAQIQRFDEVTEKAGLQLTPTEWEGVDARVTERFENFLRSQEKTAPSESAGRRARNSLANQVLSAVLSFFRKPLVAYLMVLTLLYPAYRGVVQKPEVVREVVKEREIVAVPKSVFEVGTARSFNLAQVRRPVMGESGADERGTRIELGDQEDLFILSFFIAINPQRRYDAEIVDGNEHRIWQAQAMRSDDGYGNFSLVCHRRLFAAGNYELRVREVNRQTGQVYKQYSFRFKR